MEITQAIEDDEDYKFAKESAKMRGIDTEDYLEMWAKDLDSQVDAREQILLQVQEKRDKVRGWLE